jgi:Flp pilus assembly protein TadG
MTGEGDRGAADALGLVLIAPAVIGLALLVVALGREVDAREQVRSAAESSAQAAALERTAGAATLAANAVARAMLVEDPACSEPTIAVDYPTSSPARAGDTRGFVEVTITCHVSNRGVEVIRPDRSVEVVTAIAAVDFFRASGDR